jgi:hypothetical protein
MGETFLKIEEENPRQQSQPKKSTHKSKIILGLKLKIRK